MLLKIKTIWKNRKQIFEGIQNSLFKKASIEKIAKERLKICKSCAFIDEKGEDCMLPGTQPCCSICGCKLSLKTRSLSSECPFPGGAKWAATMTQDEEDSLYRKINYNPDKK